MCKSPPITLRKPRHRHGGVGLVRAGARSEGPKLTRVRNSDLRCDHPQSKRGTQYPTHPNLRTPGFFLKLLQVLSMVRPLALLSYVPRPETEEFREYCNW